MCYTDLNEYTDLLIAHGVGKPEFYAWTSISLIDLRYRC